MILIEKVNKIKLEQVIHCTNIPIQKPDDEFWANNLQEMLKKYTGTVEYHKKIHGRYFGNGLQTCQRDIRKYLADDNYIDIDIENCHPVIIENLMIKNNIKVPEFLNKYNKDRSKVIKDYNLENKLYIIKLINNQVCFDTRKDILEFHTVLYTYLVPILVKKYPKIIINNNKNKLGSFIASVLQDIENDILMVMFNKCTLLKITVGVLIFDGMMIEKQTYYPELLEILQNEIYENLNYQVILTEKSMYTDWIPKLKDDFKQLRKLKDDTLIKELDFISSQSSISIHDIKHLEIFNRSNKFIEAFMNATGIEPIHNMVSTKCKMIKLYADCTKDGGYKIKCSNCEFVYPPENIAINKDISPNIYNLILVNQEADIKNKQTEDVAKFLLNHTKILFNNKLWYKFNDISGIYEKYEDIEIQLHLCEIIENMKDNNEKEEWFMWLKNITYKKSLLEEMKIQCFSKKPLDNDVYLLGFNNGVYDLKNSIFRQGTPDDLVTMKCGVDYSNDYNTDLTWSILNDMFPNPEECDFVVCKLALCLEGYNREQKITFNYGYTASNGKSFLMEITKSTLGDYADIFPVTVVTGKMKQAGDTNSTLSAFKNKRFLYCSEPEAGLKINSNYIKTLTGDTIKVRGLYSISDEEINPTYKMFMCCNTLPNFDTYDEGIARRISLLEYKTKFCVEPHRKNEKLLKKYSKEELSNIHKGLLVILLNKYSKLKHNNFKYPEPMYLKTLCNLYLNDNKNVIKDVLLENFDVGESKDFVKLKDIKETLKKNGLIEKDVITLKYLIEDTFEGVEFRETAMIDRKNYRNIILKLHLK
jgi:P4 family phage/plasmid primase-like protien